MEREPVRRCHGESVNLTDDGVDVRGSTDITPANNTVCGNGHHQIVQREGAVGNALETNGC